VPDYKLIAVDVDGTLLNSAQEITERTKAALRRAVERGATLAVATGRRRHTAQPIAERLDLPFYLVSSQGAALWQDGRLLAHSHLPAANARVALDVIQDLGMAAAILGNALEQEEVIWAAGDVEANPRMAAYLDRNRRFVLPLGPETFDHDPIEFIVVDDMERLQRLDEALTGHQAPVPSEDAPAQEGPSPTRPLWRVIFSRNQFTAGGAVEVVGPDTSKASALAVLCERLGITRDQLIAFGDNVNDLEMLAFAGLGVAMGNSTPDARAVADRVAPTNDEDGIAVTLEELGLA
jgi:hydroxymethylpyrimidine pyrophosphatase-like HAD family hydrolase